MVFKWLCTVMLWKQDQSNFICGQSKLVWTRQWTNQIWPKQSVKSVGKNVASAKHRGRPGQNWFQVCLWLVAKHKKTALIGYWALHVSWTNADQGTWQNKHYIVNCVIKLETALDYFMVISCTKHLYNMYNSICSLSALFYLLLVLIQYCS